MRCLPRLHTTTITRLRPHPPWFGAGESSVRVRVVGRREGRQAACRGCVFFLGPAVTQREGPLGPGLG